MNANLLLYFSSSTFNEYWTMWAVLICQIWKWLKVITVTIIIGFVGELHYDRNTDSKHMLFTHMNITIQYNKDRFATFYMYINWCSEIFLLLALYNGFLFRRSFMLISPKKTQNLWKLVKPWT